MASTHRLLTTCLVTLILSAAAAVLADENKQAKAKPDLCSQGTTGDPSRYQQQHGWPDRSGENTTLGNRGRIHQDGSGRQVTSAGSRPLRVRKQWNPRQHGFHSTGRSTHRGRRSHFRSAVCPHDQWRRRVLWPGDSGRDRTVEVEQGPSQPEGNLHRGQRALHPRRSRLSRPPARRPRTRELPSAQSTAATNRRESRPSGSMVPNLPMAPTSASTKITRPIPLRLHRTRN